MTKYVRPQPEYDLPARRISGSHDEKVAQIDEAIQELLDVKLLECVADQPNVRFIAARQRSHWFGITVTLAILLILLVLLLGVQSARGQDPAPSAPAQAAVSSDDEIWSHVKFGAVFEGFYEYDGNRPDDRVIPLHAYDTRANAFGVQQAALLVEDPPNLSKGRRSGLRLDLQFGQAVSVLQGSAANEPRPDLYRNVWQVYGTYIFPVGRGLQVDFGKFASNLGYETNYAKDNNNFARAYLYNFLPYYHTGVRTTLPVNDKITVMYMLTNGIQQTEDFNNFKSNHFTAIVKPAKNVTWTTSYFFGKEQPDHDALNGPDGWFRVFDTQATVTPTDAITLGLDLSHTSNEVHSGADSLVLNGLGAYARYQVTAPSAVSARYEYLHDDGLFGRIAQVLQEVTLTAEYKLADGFLVRGEIRRDWSDASFFTVHGGGASDHQNTALVGLVWWIGNKSGTW